MAKDDFKNLGFQEPGDKDKSKEEVKTPGELRW